MLVILSSKSLKNDPPVIDYAVTEQMVVFHLDHEQIQMFVIEAVLEGC